MTKDRVIKFTGILEHEDGTKEEVRDRPVAFVDAERTDYSAGITGSWMTVCDPDKLMEEDPGYSVDPDDFLTQECEQTGGHSYVGHQWSDDAESACRICTRCGHEIDPA